MTTTDLNERSKALGLHGLLAHWDEAKREPWISKLLAWEETERQRRSLERRIHNAKLGRFKPIADFDWSWPAKIDRAHVEELFELRWLTEAANVILVGPNGVGKTMIAQNLAHTALLKGHSVRCVSASELLNDLAAQDGDVSLQRRIARYCRPQLLCIDELGYLSYNHRHADLLFEVVTRRYGRRSLLLTTNKPFKEWNEVFPNATCVVTLVDRLVHHAEILEVRGNSYRLKEAREETARKKKQRASRRKTKSKKP